MGENCLFLNTRQRTATAARREAENLAYKHREGGRQNEPDDGGADAGKHTLDARVFQKVFDERRNDEDDDKGGEDDAQRCNKRPQKPRLR